MSLEIILVLSILGIALILFITEWVRMDIVALLVLGSLAIIRPCYARRSPRRVQ